ncbi:MAG: DUF58 domain-containing protein [bacterium]|nr:DUF58 domain-containing protein [bacterium]
MIPSFRALVALAAWTALGGILAFVPVVEPLWVVLGVLGLAVFLGDALLAWWTPAPHVTRDAPNVLSMQAHADIVLRLANRHRRALQIELFDHVPVELETDDFPRSFVIPAGEEAVFDYRVRPVSRGTAHFGPTEMRIASPLHLFDRVHRPKVDTRVRIYPNFDAVRHYELLATEHRTSQLGVRRRPRRGAGLEFQQLREYRPGDPLRQVDWKATSRFQRAISREYQDERDQQIILVLDCGRRMRAQDGELSHLDAALDAALLVAHVALRQGDAVGFSTLGGEQRWLAPRKGRGQLGALLDGAFDLHAQPRASDHLSTAAQLMGRIRKRSLIVWISNLRDEDGSELSAAMKLMARRHLVMLASLRETVLDARLEDPVQNLEDATRVSAIHHYLHRRRQAHRALETGGALLLDTTPEKLPIALVNGYLDVKSAGLL